MSRSKPTVVIGEPVSHNHPYRHQGAYAIRRPQPSPSPQIPEDVIKSYERQQLPVRKQSLAATTVFYEQQREQDPGSPLQRPLSPLIPKAELPTPSPVDTSQKRYENIVSSPVSSPVPNSSTRPFFEHPGAGALALSEEEEDEDEEDGEDEMMSLPVRSSSEDSARTLSGDSSLTHQDCCRQQTNRTALLSHLASHLYSRIVPESVIRDGVEYHYLFTGTDIVDRLLDIIAGAPTKESHDRNRALMAGRALEAHDLFHDVHREHWLLDSPSEFYRFTEDTVELARKQKESDVPLAVGVLTTLTPCYSPTCRPDQLCYSAACPNAMRKRSQSCSTASDKDNEKTLWIHSVPKDVVTATPPEERKRQECIYELIYTEEDYVKDLEYVEKHWIKPLMSSDVITPAERREKVVHEIFWNLVDIQKVNSRLASALIDRREKQDVIDTIGDILLSFICEFEPYIAYGAHQVVGKHYFELEKIRNNRFAHFVEETERKPESRRLELNGYLTKPTTRLGRYNLLLREILKRTPQGNPDFELIPQAMEMISRLLERVDEETGIAEKSFRLQLIDARLSFKSTNVFVDLQLLEPERQLIMQGRMKRKGKSPADSSSSEVQVFLFDHYLVMAKVKHSQKIEHYKVFRKPIPLGVLSLSVVDPEHQRSKSSATGNGAASPSPSQDSIIPSTSTSSSIKGYGIIFYHHGRGGSPPITLYTSTKATREHWVEKILLQKEVATLHQPQTLVTSTSTKRKTSKDHS